MDGNRMRDTARIPETFSREVLADMLEDLPLGVAVHGGPGFTCLYANAQARATSEGRELVGLPFADAWPEHSDRVLPLMQRVLETGEPHLSEDRPFGLRQRPGEPPEQRFITFSWRRLDLDGAKAVLVTARDTTDEVRARRVAEREAAELDEVFERMGDAFFALDRDWCFTYVNHRATELLGKPKEQLAGRSIWDVFGQAEGSKFDVELHRAMSEQTAVAFQEYYPPLDMWASVQAYPSPTGLSVFLSNITSLKQQEAALGTSEGALRAVIDNSPSVIQMKDLDGVFIRVNEEFARLFDRPKGEVIGKSDRDLLPPESADRLEAHDRQVRQAGHPITFEEEVSTPVGGARRYLTTKFPLKDASGRVYGTAGISVDITQRAEQERRLVESEERFRKVFEEGPIGVVLVEPVDLRIVAANDAYRRIIRYPRHELTRLSLLDVTADEDRAKTRQLVDLVLKGEIPFYRWEKRYVRRNDALVWVSVTGSLLRDETGRPSLFLGMVEDITQRKQAETALRDKDLAIRKAYSDVIGAVTGGKLILMTPDELHEVVGEMVGPEWRATEYSQFSVMRRELAAVLLSQGLSEDETNSYVLAATEAVTNAVKHGGSGTMCVRRAGESLQIEVADHGPGIDFEDLPKATLVSGFSTKATLGMGFTIMLEVCDRLLLTTQPGLTILVLEKSL